PITAACEDGARMSLVIGTKTSSPLSNGSRNGNESPNWHAAGTDSSRFGLDKSMRLNQVSDTWLKRTRRRRRLPPQTPPRRGCTIYSRRRAREQRRDGVSSHLNCRGCPTPCGSSLSADSARWERT